MEDDLTELARICLEHAKAAQTPKAAAALRRMAKDYKRRAAPSGNGEALKRGRLASRKQPKAAASAMDDRGISLVGARECPE
jgi:hypothetical protein